MNNTEIVLKLVLDELGLEMTHDNVQFAIYIAQAAGIPLSYDYGWYGSKVKPKNYLWSIGVDR